MKKVLFVLSLVLMSALSFSKTINLDAHLDALYTNGDYKKCYDLAKVINKGKYGTYYLAPFDITYNEKNTYYSEKSKYYELHCLEKIDINSFRYMYMSQNEDMLKYYSKNEIYPEFLKWADSLNASSIENDIHKTLKINEVYKFLSNDTIARDIIFSVDNSNFIKFMSDLRIRYKNVDLLKLKSNDFNFTSTTVLTEAPDKIQSEMYEFFKNETNTKRFINEKQIVDYLYKNTNLSSKEKMFVTYYFFDAFLAYRKSSSTIKTYTEYTDLDKIILYRRTVCNGYALILKHFLSINEIKCFHITTNYVYHANNILVYDNKVYYVDLTWGIYFRDITTYPMKFEEHNSVCDYSKIKSLEYVKFVDNADIKIDYFKSIINKKGA